MLKIAAAIGVGLFLATAGLAQTQQQPTKTLRTHEKDPNRIVCQKEDSIGSRLAAKKICLTQKEWDLRQAADRDEAERVQRDTATIPSG